MNKFLKVYRICFLLIGLVLGCQKPAQVWMVQPPGVQEYCKIDPLGQTVLPNGRYITPAGKTMLVAPHPYGLTLSPDGQTLVTANSGTEPLSISIIDSLATDRPRVRQIPEGASTDRGILASVFMGLAVSPDNRTVYVAGGETNQIYLFDLASGKKTDSISCALEDSTGDFSDGYLGDLVLSADGQMLYIVDQIGFRMIIADTRTKKLVSQVSVGRYPFGICLSPDGRRVWVANVGMFQYRPLPGVNEENASEKAWKFPPFEYLSKEAELGFVTADSQQVPGLGKPNVPESFSVFGVDIADPQKPRVSSKIKTGHLVGALVEGIPAVGGASPNSLVATSEYVFVSNGNNDLISVISTTADTVIKEIVLRPDERVKQFRGVIPFGLTLSPDQKTLFVAEAGINAVAVIDISTLQVLGHIPAGWFPSKLAVSPDGKNLYVANAKGFGSGPNGGANFKPGPEGHYVGNLMRGTVQIVEIPDAPTLKQYTQQVLNNNYRFVAAQSHTPTQKVVPMYPGAGVSPIKHIIFISKENRTYDEVYAQLHSGRGDSTLARFGAGVTFTNRDKSKAVTKATIMPNHLLLARQFAISDNFYVDADHSADGHRWLVNTYPNQWTETCTAASYGGNRSFKPGSSAPGIYAMNGAAGAIYPEDYNEAGSMWDHLLRHDVPFYNFGFSIMFEPGMYENDYKYEGIRHIINYPLPQGLYTRTSRQYPSYNMAIPDQFRVDQFMREFENKWGSGRDTLPAVLTVILPNDHGAGERPEAGFPFKESYMADNDLAVGRIVEFLTHTPYWKNMLIVITEDDSQDGRDHVDAHRSVLMVISPYVQRGKTNHVHYSFGSIFKTFWNILGVPYLNQYDACAADLADFFTDTPDYTPYKAVPVDVRVFDPQLALDPYDEKFDWKAMESAPGLDEVEDFIKSQKEDPAWRQGNK